MKPFRRALPSLNALMTFEAAARLGSFTAAARELGVTQAAVSHQVQMLEKEFGVLLFQRSHRKVVVTAAGTVLAGTLNSCFERIRDTADLIRQPTQTDTLTVGSTLAFSHLWLLPRIASFRSLHPDIAIRIVTQDSAFDLVSDDVDVILRFGSQVPRGGEMLASVTDIVYPVASPGFGERFPGPIGIGELRRCPLIASDTPDRTWISWGEWIERVGGAGMATIPTLRFTNYTDCVQAAIAGQGVALGWDFLLRRLIEAGQLIRLSELEVVAEGSYQLVASTRRLRTEAVAAFIEWTRCEFTDGSTAGPG